jgi:hypothetical protein
MDTAFPPADLAARPKTLPSVEPGQPLGIGHDLVGLVTQVKDLIAPLLH